MADTLLTRKLGPLPTWGWLGIATAGFGAYYLYSKNSSASTGTSSTTSSSAVPDYVFQNYNQVPAPAPPPVHNPKPGPKPGPKPKPKRKPKPPVAHHPRRHHPGTHHPAHGHHGRADEPEQPPAEGFPPARKAIRRRGRPRRPNGGVLAHNRHTVISRTPGGQVYGRGN